MGTVTFFQMALVENVDSANSSCSSLNLCQVISIIEVQPELKFQLEFMPSR